MSDTDRVERRGDDIPVERPVCAVCGLPLDAKEHLAHAAKSDEDDTKPEIVRHG